MFFIIVIFVVINVTVLRKGGATDEIKNKAWIYIAQVSSHSQPLRHLQYGRLLPPMWGARLTLLN